MGDFLCELASKTLDGLPWFGLGVALTMAVYRVRGYRLVPQKTDEDE